MIDKYVEYRDIQSDKNRKSKSLASACETFTREIIKANYVKNFTWMGIPILQYPSDMFVMQELIWHIKPHVMIETGMAFGGTAIFYSNILKNTWDNSELITIDIDMRVRNWERLRSHRAAGRIITIEGDSTSETVASEVREIIAKMRKRIGATPRVLVALDSHHTHDHVLKELELYSPLVSVYSYIVVFDTAIEFFMSKKPKDRPWCKGNNPHTAVMEFTKKNKDFIINKNVESRSLITAAIDGWLMRVN